MEYGKYERITDTHVYFLKGPLSQWYTSEFSCTNFIQLMLQYTGEFHKYTNCEQWMMHAKALVFNDLETATKIMEAKSPNEIKDLGRLVKNYDENIWNICRFVVVTEGNFLKFNNSRRSKEYSEFLKTTGTKTIVEANGCDKIWGVGLYQDNDDILDESKWRGQNLLGRALMTVRDGKTNSSEYLEKKNLIIDEILTPLVRRMRS